MTNVLKDKREVWQRGPVANIPALLQPVAHALLQAREELYDMMQNFKEELLWERPGGAASPAFHLQHLTGVLNRLFTYAKEQGLSDEQFVALAREGKQEQTTYGLSTMLELFNEQVDICLLQLGATDTNILTNNRIIGRQKIGTTLIGLYVHAAEHTMRHIGQLLVTIKVLQQD